MTDKEHEEPLVSNDNPNEPAPEQPAVVAEEKEEPKGLSLQDAIEVAVAAEEEREPVIEYKPKKNKHKNEQHATEKKEVQDTPLEPPAEYTAEEKADFLALSRKGQEAQLRLDRSRKAKLDDINRALNEQKELAKELGWSKELVKEVTPYLKTVGEKKNPHEALILALKMRNELENGDPYENAVNYLKAKGAEVPEALLNSKKKGDDNLRPLQDRLSQLESQLAEERNLRLRAQEQEANETLSSAWVSFQQAKNAAGDARFPDVNDTDAGIELARNIGSLVNGNTPLSKEFIANANRRIPGLTYQGLLAEAYKWSGGKVAEADQPPRSQTSQNQIVKARRAASSVPGGGAQEATTPRKGLTLQEAALLAYREFQEQRNR